MKRASKSSGSIRIDEDIIMELIKYSKLYYIFSGEGSIPDLSRFEQHTFAVFADLQRYQITGGEMKKLHLRREPGGDWPTFLCALATFEHKLKSKNEDALVDWGIPLTPMFKPPISMTDELHYFASCFKSCLLQSEMFDLGHVMVSSLVVCSLRRWLANDVVVARVGHPRSYDLSDRLKRFRRSDLACEAVSYAAYFERFDVARSEWLTRPQRDFNVPLVSVETLNAVARYQGWY